jgi:hypothetical protein
MMKLGHFFCEKSFVQGWDNNFQVQIWQNKNLWLEQGGWKVKHFIFYLLWKHFHNNVPNTLGGSYENIIISNIRVHII